MTSFRCKNGDLYELGEPDSRDRILMVLRNGEPMDTISVGHIAPGFRVAIYLDTFDDDSIHWTDYVEEVYA